MSAPTRKPVQRKSYGQQPIDHLFGDYRVLRVMSRGSLGTLHVAEDTGTGHVVLLRVLPRKLTALPKIRQTLEQDLSRLEQVDHRNVTRVQARGLTDGRLYYVLDFPSSVTLMDFVRDRGVLRGLELLWLAAGLTSGLAALHQAGLAHGNLWPAKVALSKLGPVLVDLSWSSRLRGATPEPAADLDMLAATISYAATGKLPGQPGGADSETLQLPQGVPGPVLRLLESIAMPPGQRPAASQLADDLQAQIDELLLEGSGPLEPLYERLDELSEALPGLSDPREESGGIPLPNGFSQLLGNPTVVDPPTATSPPPAARPPARGPQPRRRPSARRRPAHAHAATEDQPSPTKQGTTENEGPPPPRARPPRRPSGRDKATSPPNVHHLRPGLAVQQIRLLGEGGMGVVHLVRDPVLQRQAALKLVRGASQIRLSRFQRETSVTARLDHPSIPPVFEAGTTMGDDEPYLLMRFVDGESLSEILQRRDAEQSGYQAEVQTRQLLQALIKVAEGVSFAHSRRIVHRDLKPANIMVGAFGEVFVMDWGLARDLSESAEEDARARSELANDRNDELPSVQGLTQEGTILGTPGYMAPEQARGEDVDAQADIFALGAILCEVLTGKPPFTGPTPLAVLGLNRAGEVEYPRQRYRDVNLELDAISRKALAPECEDRYATTEEFVNDLRAFVDGRAVSVYDYNRFERFGRFTRRHPSLVSAALATCLLLIGVPYAVMRSRLAEVNEVIEQAQVALNEGDASRAAYLFDRAILLDEDNHVAHLGLREAHDMERVEERNKNKLQADGLIAEGNAKLAQGDLEGALAEFMQAKVLEHPDALRLVIQVEQAIEEDRSQEDARAMELLSEQEAHKHRARGILLMERGEFEDAQVEFIKAIGFGLKEVEADLLRVEEELVAKRDAELQQERQLKSRRLTGQAEELLNNKPSVDDLERVRNLLIQALGFYGNNERARAGLLRLDRLTQRLEERRRQKLREHAAGKELGVARRSTRRARDQVNANYDPDEIRKTFLDAMSAYDRAQYLLPDHSGIQRERAEVARDFSRHLVMWGQQDLATYFLESSGIDPADGESPVAPLQDQVIEVVEAQLAKIRNAFGGGTVRAQPTRAFDGLRDYLHGLGERYRVQIQVRSETTSDQPPKVLAEGLWIKVTDTETNTVHPTLQINFEGGPFIRPVMVTENGHRLIRPWNKAHNLDEARYVAEVERRVREQLGQAQRTQ